ncbi:hypothetical protein WJX72_008137 [[Myrmecia] bisecta]|uniref:Uncharacterized protein n=1 Tax=[Myrmecia] bisecta TaxID=41462 RepID=A0AAW1Q4D7_9CHLO
MLEVYLGYLVGQIRTGELSLELNLQGAENFFTLACFREAAFLKQLGPTLTVIQLYGMLQITQPLDLPFVLPYLQRLELVQHDDQKLDHVSLCHIGEAVARLRRARRPVWLYVFHPNPETDDEAEEEDHEGDNDSDGYY